MELGRKLLATSFAAHEAPAEPAEPTERWDGTSRVGFPHPGRALAPCFLQLSLHRLFSFRLLPHNGEKSAAVSPRSLEKGAAPGAVTRDLGCRWLPDWCWGGGLGSIAPAWQTAATELVCCAYLGSRSPSTAGGA